MTLTTADLLELVDAMTGLQMDQVASLTEGDPDDDAYNINALREIQDTLQRIQDRFDGDVDLWAEIAHAEVMVDALEVDA